MKLVKRTLVIVVGTTLLCSGTVVGQRRYEPNAPDSFLRFQVDSTEELAGVLQSDAVLRRRFARHFGVSEDEIVDYVQRALVPYRLPRARTVTVYGVTRTGRVYAVRSRLRKGTRVWATRSGVPILKWLCANPFTKTLPGTQLPEQPRTARQRGFRGGRVASLPAGAVGLPTVPAETELLTPGLPTLLSGEGFAPLAGVPGVSLPGFPIGALIPFAFLPIVTGGGGGGTTPSAEIPEPATLGLVAAGLPVLAALGLRRRRRGIDG